MILLSFVLIVALIVYQITGIITESKLFMWFRELFNPIREDDWEYHTWIAVPLGVIYNLMTCFLCTSVWVSAVISAYLYNQPYIVSSLLSIDNFYVGLFFNAMAYSGLAWLFHCLENYWSR